MFRADGMSLPEAAWMKPSTILVDRRGRAACRFGFSLIVW